MTKTKKSTVRVSRPPVTVTVPAGQRVFVLDVPFLARSWASAQGARWHEGLRCWLYVGSRLPAGLEMFASQAYTWARWIEDDLNGEVRPEPSGGGMEPRPHQLEARDYLLAVKAVHDMDGSRSGAVIADGTGVGKTLSAWAGVRDMPGVRNVLVICPLGGVANWRRTIRAAGDGGKRVCVTTWDRLKHLLDVPDSALTAKRTRTKNKRIAAHGTRRVEWDVVIADESHLVRHPTTQRAAAYRNVRGDSFTVWLSATIGQNPLELSYLAPLLADLTGHHVRDLAEFEQWCAAQGIAVRRGQYGRWEWEENERDLNLVRDLLFGEREDGLPGGIRRLPEHLAGWPELNRFLLPVGLAAEERWLYKQAWDTFRREKGLTADGKGKGLVGLAAWTRFRQKASLIRVPTTVEQIEEFLDNGFQVLVSVVWTETLDTIRETLETKKIPVSVYDGRMTAAEKETSRVAFQRGETRVVVFTVAESVSFHAGETTVGGNNVPRVMIVHDVRPGGLPALQVEGRGHRDGQRCDVYYTYAEGTVEEDIAEIVVRRMRTTKQMSGDDVETLREIEAAIVRRDVTDPAPEPG